MNVGKITLAAVWIAIAATMFLLADRALHPNRLSELGEGHSVTLQRGLDGHYRTEALINGIKVSALVDTGASGVAIPSSLADRLGLHSGTAVRTRTANGDAVAYMTRLDSVRIGGVEARDVAAMITPGLSGEVLLGMSFLGRMDVRLYQGTMTITQVEP
ncbi:MAG TPA: retropepsin-like aspartic protease [Methylophilaceae bacterium]|jgi:aspartyl protease family protein